MWRLSLDGKGGYDKAYIAEPGRNVEAMLLDGDTLICTASACCSEEHHEYRVKIA